MVKFKCYACGYEYEPKNKDTTKPPKMCPYCGKQSTVEAKKHILQEINDLPKRKLY